MGVAGAWDEIDLFDPEGGIGCLLGWTKHCCCACLHSFQYDWGIAVGVTGHVYRDQGNTRVEDPSSMLCLMYWPSAVQMSLRVDTSRIS